MTTKLSARLLAPAAVLAVVGCGDLHDEDVTTVTSALAQEISSGPRAFISGNHTPFSVARVPNGGIIEYIGTTPSQLAFFPVHVEPTAAPWGYIRYDGVTSILYVDSSGHVHEISTDTLSYSYVDTDLANPPVYAPIAKVGTTNAPTPDVIGHVRIREGQPENSIVYVGADNHVIELYGPGHNTPPDIPYLVWDISRQTGIYSGSGSAFPHTRADGINGIYYIAGDNHIHEFSSDWEGWVDNDLYIPSQETSAPRSDPWAYTRSDGVDSVVFEGSDNRIHELTLQNCCWAHWTLPSALSNNGLRGRPSGYVRADSVSTVVYVASDINKRTYSVHELALVSSAWVDTTLPIAASEVPQGQTFGISSPGFSSVFFRVNVNLFGVIYSFGRELVRDAFGHWGEYQLP